MARTVYFDCFSGASGDMVLGALLDLGLPLEGLRAALGSLAIEYGDVGADRVLRAGVSAVKFRLVAGGQTTSGRNDDRHHHHHGHEHPHDHDHHHPPEHPHGPDQGGHQHHYTLKAIASQIERSALSREGKDRAIHLFQRLGEAEAAIHQTPVDQVHLHEVGALDSIIDIVGAVYGMEWLQASEIVASPLNVGSGTVRCAHGEFPVPAPATAWLLKGVPVYAGPVPGEMVTPTGALLVSAYAQRYGPLPAMRLESIGYGAGDRDVSNHPNVLRVLLGETAEEAQTEHIVVLECEIDDMNPQLFGPLMDRLYAGGALEVFYVPVQMKKNRPGTLVTVLADPAMRDRLSSTLFTETTTIGVRYQLVQRERLEREIQTIETPFGPIRFKVARRHGRIVNASSEFEDCARAAAERQIAVKDVQAAATKAWLDSRSG